MSATKYMLKWVKTATPAQLDVAKTELEAAIAAERNPMKRSSLKEQLRTVEAEQNKRALTVPR